MKKGLRRTKADDLFSQCIRERADWTCERCGANMIDNKRDLHCSHFISRSKKSVRFDFDNAAALCVKCHWFFDGYTMFKIQPHKKEHQEFFEKRLGKTRFNLLLARAELKRSVKMPEKLICEWLTDELEKIKSKKPMVLGAH